MKVPTVYEAGRRALELEVWLQDIEILECGKWLIAVRNLPSAEGKKGPWCLVARKFDTRGEAQDFVENLPSWRNGQVIPDHNAMELIKRANTSEITRPEYHSTREMAEYCGISEMEYDTALPQDWFENFHLVTGFSPVGTVVWLYPEGSIFGEPYPVTEEAAEELRVYEKYKNSKWKIILPTGMGKPMFTDDITAAKEMVKYYGKGTQTILLQLK